MATPSLTQLEVFNEYSYLSMTEILQQNIALFNEATKGAIMLRESAHQGDYTDEAFFKKLTGLVRRRDAYDDGTTDVSAINIEHLLDTSVKVAAGTPPVNIPPSQYRWIMRQPEEAGAAMGKQLAVDAMADMLDTALLCLVKAQEGTPSILTDVSAAASPLLSLSNLHNATRPFGDRVGKLSVWVLHSKPMLDFYADAIANATRLFTYGDINVMADPMGRIFIVTDSPSLHYTDGGEEHYRTLGLRAGAVYVGRNDDYEDNWETSNGKENIQRNYQAEWSFNVGLQGYRWNKPELATSPTTDALGTAANWPQNVSQVKDLAGVQLVTL